MITYTILLTLFLTLADSRNLGEENHPVQQRWHRLVHKLTDHFNIDHRPLNDDDVLLFPDVAFQSLHNNTWKVVVHGWKYRNNPRNVWLGSSMSVWLERLAKNLVNHNDILYLNGSVNRDRLRPFFATDGVNEEINIQIGDREEIVQTDASGEFYEQIELTDDEIEEQRNGSWINYEAIYDEERQTMGIIRLIEPKEGISVISDIDDTIKISEVLDKVRLLANTFIYPFKSVPGMSNLYQEWQATNPNCTFHYLSGMPDQLYTLTQEFIQNNSFPDGSFHMRHFGWRLTSLFDFLHSQSTFDHKMSYLRFFLSNTIRDYVLIGDSGEKDPEIYGTIAREYPQRIRAIFIRAIKSEAFDDQRFRDAFQGVPEEKWLIFNDPKQVPVDLSRAPRTLTG